MNTYIATFFSHFGAMQYFKALRNKGITARLMPVPRKISASCGTCVRYEHDAAVDLEDCELDGVYVDADGVFERVISK